MKQKSSVFNLDANIVVMIAYLGGLIFRWTNIACYFAWAIPLIIYLIESKNEFVKKQSAQATLLYLISSVLSILIYIFLIIFAPSETADIYNMIITGSLLLIGLVSLLATIIAIAIAIFAIVAIVKTYNYEDYNIPYLSRYLDKFRKYLELLEGKNKNKTSTTSKNDSKYNYAEEKQSNNHKIKQHKIRKQKKLLKEKIKKTSSPRTRVQKIHK